MFKKSILALVAMAAAFLPVGFIGTDGAEPVLTVAPMVSNKTWLEEWFSDPTVVWTVVVLLIFLVLIVACFMYLKKLDS